MSNWLTQLFEKKKSGTAPGGSEEERATVLIDVLPTSQRGSNTTTPENTTASRVEPPAQDENTPLNISLPSIKAAEDEAARIIYQSSQGTDETKRQVIALLRSLVDRTITDAELYANRIGITARQEAEEEASRILEIARRNAEEIRRRVETVDLQEAEDLLSVAGAATQDTAEEAKQRLQAYLIKMRGQIEVEVREEMKRNRFRALSSFLGRIKGALLFIKNGNTQKREGKQAHFPALSSRLNRNKKELPMPSTNSPGTSDEILIDAEENKPPEELQVPVDSSALRLSLETEQDDKSATPVQETLEKLVFGEPVTSQTAEQPTEEIPKPQISGSEPASQDSPDIMPKLDTEALYEGEIELAIAAPVDLAAVTKLYNYLQTTPDMKILYTRGSWDRGTLITVTLDKPLPFFSMISRIPGLGITPALSQKDNFSKAPAGSLLGATRKSAARIVLNLRLV